MANKEIRLAVAGNGMHLWELAEAMGISEFTLSRKLRHELNEEEKKHIMDIINEMKEMRNEYKHEL